MAIEQISVHFTDPDLVEKLANFLVKDGLTDRKEEVRKKMLSAAVVTVDHHGKDTAEHLLPVFEEFLDNAPKEHVNKLSFLDLPFLYCIDCFCRNMTMPDNRL